MGILFEQVLFYNFASAKDNMEFLFGKKKTTQQMLRENQRSLNRVIRDLDRERTRMEQQHKENGQRWSNGCSEGDGKRLGQIKAVCEENDHDESKYSGSFTENNHTKEPRRHDASHEGRCKGNGTDE